MTHEEKQLKELLHGFAEQTTAHGISQIASSKSLFWRIFWVLVTLGGGGMVIYQGILLVNTYMSKPIKSDIDITYRRTIKFPAVTICNLNIIRKSFLREASHVDTNASRITADTELDPTGGLFDEEKINILKRFLRTDSSDAEENLNLENATIDPEEYIKQRLLINLANYSESDLEKGGHHFRELVFRCNFKGFSCKDSDFLKYWKKTWNWRYGNCFTFNSGVTSQGKRIPVLTITKPGPQYGLELDLFVNQKEYIPILSPEAGVRVLITRQRSIPFPVDEGFTVSPGFATSIGLRQLSITRVDPFNNRSCYNPESVEKFSVYKRYKRSRYSVQGCMYSCLARAQVKNCNCTEMKFPSVMGICTTTSEVRCIQEMQRRYDDDGLGCSAKCPQPCTQVSYRMSSSSSAWSVGYERLLQSFMLKDKDSDIHEMGKSKDVFRNNFLRIKIYFEELNMEKVTYSEYYELENLMSDIGGQLGLWIGVSAITVAEVLKLLLDVIKVLFRKRCVKDIVEVKDINMVQFKNLETCCSPAMSDRRK